MENIKQVNIKNHTYYLFNDMINIKDFNSSLIKIDIYNIGCITIKKINDYENINSVNPLYLIICKADGYIEENNRNKYLVFTSTDGSKKVLTKFTKLWDKIKHLIEVINEGEHETDYMKIKFNSNDNLPLSKILKRHMLTVIARSVFEEGSKFYTQVFLGECLYEV